MNNPDLHTSTCRSMRWQCFLRSSVRLFFVCAVATPEIVAAQFQGLIRGANHQTQDEKALASRAKQAEEARATFVKRRADELMQKLSLTQAIAAYLAELELRLAASTTQSGDDKPDTSSDADAFGGFLKSFNAAYTENLAYVQSSVFTGIARQTANTSVAIRVTTARAVARPTDATENPPTELADVARQSIATERMLAVLQNGGNAAVHLTTTRQSWRNNGALGGHFAIDVGMGTVNSLGSDGSAPVAVGSLTLETAIRVKLFTGGSKQPVGAASFGIRAGASAFTDISIDPLKQRRGFAYGQALLQVEGPNGLAFGMTLNTTQDQSALQIRRVQLFTSLRLP